MSRILLDTCIFSYIFKGDPRAIRYGPLLDAAEPCLSFMSVAELYRWVLAHRWGAPRLRILKADISECVFLTYDDETAWRWAQLMAIRGRPMPSADAYSARNP